MKPHVFFRVEVKCIKGCCRWSVTPPHFGTVCFAFIKARKNCVAKRQARKLHSRTIFGKLLPRQPVDISHSSSYYRRLNNSSFLIMEYYRNKKDFFILLRQPVAKMSQYETYTIHMSSSSNDAVCTDNPGRIFQNVTRKAKRTESAFIPRFH